MLHGRYGHDASLGPDGKIYIMGGIVFKVGKVAIIDKYNDGRYSNLAYDPRSDTWEYCTPVPGWILTDWFMFFDRTQKRWRNARTVGGLDDLLEFAVPGKWEWGEEKTTVARDDRRNTDLERQGNGVAIVTGKEGKVYWIGGQGKWVGTGESIVLPYEPLTDQ